MSQRDLLLDPEIPLRTMVWTEPGAYDGIDAGIRFAVRVLHARGYETCQSCEGGEGHSYDNPTVDLIAGSRDANGFGAVAELVPYGLQVTRVSQVWNLDPLGRPYETIWRIEFKRPFPERADEEMMFVWGYQAQRMKGDA